MLAFLVLNYDLKLSDDVKGRPENVCFGPNLIPPPNAEISFRKRHTKA